MKRKQALEYLGLPNDTKDSNEIRKAYYAQAKKWHPDRNYSPEAEAKMQEINAAFEFLKNNNSDENNDEEPWVLIPLRNEALPLINQYNENPTPELCNQIINLFYDNCDRFSEIGRGETIRNFFYKPEIKKALFKHIFNHISTPNHDGRHIMFFISMPKLLSSLFDNFNPDEYNNTTMLAKIAQHFVREIGLKNDQITGFNQGDPETSSILILLKFLHPELNSKSKDYLKSMVTRLELLKTTEAFRFILNFPGILYHKRALTLLSVLENDANYKEKFERLTEIYKKKSHKFQRSCSIADIFLTTKNERTFLNNAYHIMTNKAINPLPTEQPNFKIKNLDSYQEFEQKLLTIFVCSPAIENNIGLTDRVELFEKYLQSQQYQELFKKVILPIGEASFNLRHKRGTLVSFKKAESLDQLLFNYYLCIAKAIHKSPPIFTPERHITQFDRCLKEDLYRETTQFIEAFYSPSDTSTTNKDIIMQPSSQVPYMLKILLGILVFTLSSPVFAVAAIAKKVSPKSTLIAFGKKMNNKITEEFFCTGTAKTILQVKSKLISPTMQQNPTCS